MTASIANTELDFPARGKVLSIDNNIARFAPAGTQYELHLLVRGDAGKVPLNTPIDLFIRLDARKVYTVPSGGNFVTPIFGPPKIIQGRVLHVSEARIVVHAGTNFIVNLPANDDAIDLNTGAIAVAKLVNVVALPGAWMEVARAGKA